jgi:phosphoribosyl-ATP pyrophosphohydrolase
VLVGAKEPNNVRNRTLLRCISQKGLPKIAQKVGEEGVEAVIAALAESDERLVSESADLLFHLVVLLKARGIDLTHIPRNGSRITSRLKPDSAPHHCASESRSRTKVTCAAHTVIALCQH